MANPNLNRQLAAIALLDAEATSPRESQIKHGISERSLQRYKKLLLVDAAFQAVYHALKVGRRDVGNEMVLPAEYLKTLSAEAIKKVERPKRVHPATRLVYLVQDASGPVKIGVATVLEERLQTLQNGNPRPLTVVCAVKTRQAFVIEKILHRQFAQKRLINEWFDLSHDEIDAAEQLLRREAAKSDQKKQRDRCESLSGSPFL